MLNFMRSLFPRPRFVNYNQSLPLEQVLAKYGSAQHCVQKPPLTRSIAGAWGKFRTRKVGEEIKTRFNCTLNKSWKCRGHSTSTIIIQNGKSRYVSNAAFARSGVGGERREEDKFVNYKREKQKVYFGKYMALIGLEREGQVTNEEGAMEFIRE